MTDIRDINSTSYTSDNIDGSSIQKIRDGLAADILLSIIIGLTILTVSTLVKSYIELFTVGMFAQLSVLAVAIVHTLVRRLRIKSKLLIFVLHVVVSVVFFFAITMIPVLEFGNSSANKIYLVLILTALTVFSFLHGIRPRFAAANSDFFLFPGLIHVILYILYALTGQRESAQNVLLHAISIAILFVIMRQIAVFDAKYYHSIHKLTKPGELLKKQNRKTVLGIIGIVAISLAVIAVFPYSLLSGFIKPVIVSVFRFVSGVFLGREDDILITPMDEEPNWDNENEEEIFADLPWLEVLGKALVIIVAVITIYLIINAIRLILLHAPKMLKPEIIKDENLTDTIENIAPEAKKKSAPKNDFGTGYERRVRKQFYDKTRNAMKKGLPVDAASTPGEIEKVLLENGDKNISSLRTEYEKVRYGK